MFRKPATRKTQPGRQVSDIFPWPAPVKGWHDSESLADMPDGSAFRLDNWFPESTSLKMRPGAAQYARILEPGETTTASLYVTIATQYTVLVNRHRSYRYATVRIGTSGHITRRGSGFVRGGDNGDADGV